MSRFVSQLSRRCFLRATGVCLGLPWLESFAARGAEQPVDAPRRLAFLYVPNGVNVAAWQCSGAGVDYQLSPTLAPLSALKRDITVITGLNHENATPGTDGGGDHARSTAVYLTGVRPKKTGGSDILNGPSIDQVIARQTGRHTRLPSLELSTDGARTTGRCDSGYSCAYQFNLSWASPTRPVPAEQNPRAVFERLFGTADADDALAAGRKQLRRSVLDFVLDDAKSLQRNLPQVDRRKLDQYFTALRETERRIERAEQALEAPPTALSPAGIPESYQEHIRLMLDLSTLAFQTDAVRVATFTLANDGSNRAFSEIGVREAHHQLSHHRNNPATLEKIAQIDRFYVEQFAWFLEHLRNITEGEGTLLDNSMVLYGSCLSEGNKHLHSNLPILLAGRGGGTLSPNKLLAAPDPTPMCNLHLALAQRMGLNLDRFGDSEGALAGI
ncbi:DUF1552 domain-containing protein [Lignipirellula cremea]|uniref:DUF1552 domain-containing protein n=1 Tax=Lignipirellula cremea TaxID=2528010 RepID=A0A518E441_9BACT|nr:DUF1552 domain-containing protein [Lignipirellula cremea]QDU98860.1 hypothetical protein Pla8534_67710 [Lignipirellula cremea]